MGGRPAEDGRTAGAGLRIHAAAFLCTWFAALAAEADGSEVTSSGLANDSSADLREGIKGYYWVRRGGSSPLAANGLWHSPGVDITTEPAWVWENELDEQTRHSPLIDDRKDIYITTTRWVRKFSPDGALLWFWIQPASAGKMTASPAIYRGNIYLLARGTSQEPWMHVFAVDMHTGAGVWNQTYQKITWGDATAIFAFNGSLIMPFRDHFVDRPDIGGEDGNNAVLAVSAMDGEVLWEYASDEVTWNFIPSTPGDGTLIFASQCGRVTKIRFGGALLWRAGKANVGLWCGCGGGVLGPNGVFYAEYNVHTGGGSRDGWVSAYRASDGQLLWEKNFGPRYQGWQYPTVGKIGPSGRLAVVAPMGGITGGWFTSALVQPLGKFRFHNLYLKYSWYRDLIGIQPLYNAVVALDAATGEVIWWVEEEPWNHIGMKGDEEPLFERDKVFELDRDREDLICLPDPQGIPVVAADGTVYASSSHDGKLRAILDRDGNGALDPSEIAVFDTRIGFLNSPSMAPGLLVAAPCWGPVYVWRSRSTS